MGLRFVKIKSINFLCKPDRKFLKKKKLIILITIPFVSKTSGENETAALLLGRGRTGVRAPSITSALPSVRPRTLSSHKETLPGGTDEAPLTFSQDTKKLAGKAHGALNSLVCPEEEYGDNESQRVKENSVGGVRT